MKVRTRWKNTNSIIKNMRCNNEEIGYFRVKKIQKCHEFCKSAISVDGTHWFERKRVFITTNTGLKYIVPFLWLIFSSVDENGKFLWKIIDEEG